MTEAAAETHHRHTRAARALSEGLRRLGVEHAFIGGFALNCLGHVRETGDVDVVIDSTADDLHALVLRAVAVLPDGDRFSQPLRSLKYWPADGSPEFPVETLRTGILGLPLRLKTVVRDGLPILDPAVLILTKIKRCVMYIGSTRPRSENKFRKDNADIVFLMSRLSTAHATADFQGYAAENPDRLYTAVTTLMRHWASTNQDGLCSQMRAILKPEDNERITMAMAD